MGTLRTIVQQIPVEEVREIARDLHARGETPEAITDQIVDFLDALVDWSKVIGGLTGKALEAADGPLLRKIAAAIVKSAFRSRS